MNEKNQENFELVSWDNKYATGIELVDTQHKQLFDLTNELFEACHAKEFELLNKFEETLHQMVKYVKIHFEAEQKILKAINYPDLHEHIKQHDILIKDILAAVKDYKEDKKLVPNHFVRTLKDWIFGHIGFYDKQYSIYAQEQIKKGVLTKETLKEIQ